MSAHDVHLGRRPLHIGIDAMHKELIRGVIQQQLSRLCYLVPIRKRSMGWSATRLLRMVPSALEVWLGQAGHCIHSTQSPCHGRSAVYPRVSVVQASLSEANLYGIATFPPYTCRSIYYYYYYYYYIIILLLL